MSFAPDTGPFARPESLFRVPVGFASPLWGLFAGAAMSGAAFWWMTRWARPENLEAMFGAAARATVIEPTVEAAPEPGLEAAVQPQPAPDALAEPELAPAPVGGESASISPISPVLQAIEPEVGAAIPEPAFKPKRVESKAADAG